MELRDGFVKLEELEEQGIRSLINRHQPLPPLTPDELEARLEKAIGDYEDENLVVIFAKEFLADVRKLKAAPRLH